MKPDPLQKALIFSKSSSTILERILLKERTRYLKGVLIKQPDDDDKLFLWNGWSTKMESFIFNWDHCQRFFPLKISDTLWAGLEPVQNLSSSFAEKSRAVVITTTPQRHLMSTFCAHETTCHHYDRWFEMTVAYWIDIVGACKNLDIKETILYQGFIQALLLTSVFHKGLSFMAVGHNQTCISTLTLAVGGLSLSFF